MQVHEFAKSTFTQISWVLFLNGYTPSGPFPLKGCVGSERTGSVDNINNGCNRMPKNHDLGETIHTDAFKR